MLHIPERWVKYWDWLVSPKTSVPESQRQSARSTTSLIIILAAIFTPLTPIWIIFYNVTSPLAPIIVFCITLTVIAAYIVSKTRYFRASAWMLILMLTVAIGAVFFARPFLSFHAEGLLKYLALGVLIASFTLTIRETAFIAVIYAVSIFLLMGVVMQAPVDLVFSETVFSSIMSALILGATVLRTSYANRLRRSEQRYRALFEQSNDAIFIMRLDNTHIEANSCASKMLGYTIEEIYNMKVSDIVVQREYPESQYVMERLLNGDLIPPYERTLRTRDGIEIPVEINVGVVRDESGKPMHFQSFVRDLRGRKRTEEQLIQIGIERERSRILTHFIRGISHEFRTPLSVIGTNTYLLERSDDPELRLKRIATIQQQVERINRLLELMMMMVRLDSDETIYRAPVDINALLTNVHTHFERLAKANGLTIVTDFALDLPRISGDSRYLHEALRHLMNNAILYTPSGGTITLKSRCEQGQVIIEFHDTGVGISPENIDRVFERFFRADESHSTEGFGLGLSIVQAIIERHQGHIEVKSALGYGSTFTIYLPLPLAKNSAE